MKNKTIYILLTKHNDFLAKAFNTLTMTYYSHVSIGLEEDKGNFFSFVTKNGFYMEHPLKSRNPKKRMRECQLYKIDVTNEMYETIKNNINVFKLNKKNYKYNYIGLLFCALRNSTYKQTDHYFCSQFVSEILQTSGVIELKKDTSVFLPDDFKDLASLELCFKGTIGELIKQFNTNNFKIKLFRTLEIL